MENSDASVPTTVVLRDIDIPFWRLVQFLIIVAVAAIPAVIVVGLVTNILMTFLLVTFR